jgi:hypothetical protein
MSDNNPASGAKQTISLDSKNTSLGAMERVFLAETYAPSNPHYVAGTDLEQMRDMRQAIENRLKDPAEYDARGAKNEIDIVKMGDQIQGFSNYPKLAGDLPIRIDDNLTAANLPHGSLQAAYAQHVQDAKTAASESIVHPVAGYPNATARVTYGTPSPGAGFYALGSLGNNTFYGALPQRDQNTKSEHKTDSLEGKTPVERLRHHAAQARADAAKKPVPAHMKLHHILTKTYQPRRSYAPVHGRQGKTAAPAARNNADGWFGAQLARSSRAWAMGDSPQNRIPGVAPSGIASGGKTNGAPPPAMLAAFYGQSESFSRFRTAWNIGGAGSLGSSMAAAAMRPSMAPHMSRGPNEGGRLRQRMWHGAGDAGARQRTELPENAPMPRGSAGVETAESLVPRARNSAATESDALEMGFVQSKTTREQQMQQAMEDYFFRQSRLPPSGATALDPSLTPVWAGMKLPG